MSDCISSTIVWIPFISLSLLGQINVFEVKATIISSIPDDEFVGRLQTTKTTGLLLDSTNPAEMISTEQNNKLLFDTCYIYL